MYILYSALHPRRGHCRQSPPEGQSSPRERLRGPSDEDEEGRKNADENALHIEVGLLELFNTDCDNYCFSFF